ncbi:MAG: serine/threonine-protein kinase, partial [Candidatus Eremiobacteraeota bacterium]|nr:serine/threonine-protein kinase [Candidatus Eremiobacteraeota bacterium]
MSEKYLNRVYQDRYRVEKEIPGGEFESSFLGKDLKTEEAVHIRVIPIDTEHPELLEQSQHFVFKEVGLLQRLTHPGLPVFLESVSDTEESVIITKYIEGTPLAERLIDEAKLHEDEVLDFLDRLLPILDYLHAQTPPVIYRDLQPKSIFYDDKNNIFLTKFEQARTFKADKIKDTVIHSTRGYSPPEQAFGKGQSDARSDIYSVGMIIFQMLTGKDPTKAPLILPKVADLRNDVSPLWNSIVSKATNIKVDKRYASVKELESDLAKIKGAVAPPVQEAEKKEEKPAAEPAPAPAKKKIAIGMEEPVKPEPVKAEEPRKEEPKPEPVKAEAPKKEEPKPEPVKAEAPKKEEPRPEPVKAEAPKKEEPRPEP